MNDGIRRKEELYLCHENKEKKRCLKCGSLNTKKKGFIYSKIKTQRGEVKRRTQRFLCKDCKNNWTSNGIGNRKRVSDYLKQKAVCDYVLTKNSLEEVGRRYNISKSSILNWIDKISKKYPLLENYNNLSGIILLDGKEIKVKGEKRVLLIASDAINKMPILYGVYKRENKVNTTEFLIKIKGNYPQEITGIVSDFGRGKCFIGVVNKIFNVPHQICLVHFLRYGWMFIPRTKKSKYFFRNKMLKLIIKKVVLSPTKEEALYWLNKLKHLIPFFRASYHKKFIKSLIKNYSYLTAHFDYSYLKTNTNVIENTNRQLERKIKNLDGFKSEKNLNSFLRIWFANYIINSVS